MTDIFVCVSCKCEIVWQNHCFTCVYAWSSYCIYHRL